MSITIQHGLYMKNISRLIWGVPHDIKRTEGYVPLQGKQIALAWIQSTKVAVT